jgi:hypothetical protein
MNREGIFSIWAPEASPWSRWAKPVLFAHLDSARSQPVEFDFNPDVNWCPAADGTTALVLDLPGAEGVLVGVALAARGYRPVPLYNALPEPVPSVFIDPLTSFHPAAVDVVPIITALVLGSVRLANVTVPAAAPPAFLLDANRAGDGRRMAPDEFDNRSVSFTTDFPSANCFAAHGIGRLLLVQRNRTDPQPDLAHSLRRWQDAGFVLERKRLDLPEPPGRFEVPRPSWYGAMFQRALAGFGLRRAGSGGFGAWVPGGSAGG